MIAKIGLCLREGNFSFNKNDNNMVILLWVGITFEDEEINRSFVF